MENFDALKTLRINLSRPWNLATCALGDSLVHKQWHSPSSWNIKWDFYSDVYTIFSRILINNMDHMHISGTEPSSVILEIIILFFLIMNICVSSLSLNMSNTLNLKILFKF